MRPNNGKAVNRYYQIDGFTARGACIVTIFVKADNIEQVRAYLDRANFTVTHWVQGCHRYGIFTGKIYDLVATRFKVSPVCWRYAFACANGGLDISDNRTRHEVRNTSRTLADYLYHNLDCYRGYHRAATA